MVGCATGVAGPGEWIGVLSGRVAAVLPPQAAELAADLWVAIDRGDGFDEALDVVLRRGLAAVPSLVLVASDAAGSVRLLVRGTPSVTLSLSTGEPVVVGSGATTWTEQVVEGVVGVAVELPGADHSSPERAGGRGAVGPGLRRLGALSLGEAAAVAVPETGRDVTSRAIPVPAPVPSPEPPADDDRPHAVPVKLATPEPELPEPAPVAVLPPVPSPSPALAESLAAIDEAPGELETAPLVVTPVWASDETSVLPPVEESAPDAVTVPDEIDPAAFIPGLGSHRPEPWARLTFSHGLVVDLDAPLVVGRAPAPSAGSVDEARTVTVPSPLGEVSANHLEIRPGAGRGQVEACDLGSTNGTVLLRAGQPPVELLPGTPLLLTDGCVVDLGDGATLTVALL